MPWITYDPERCDWCKISAHLTGSQWHPTHCGEMAYEDVDRMSDEARAIYNELGLGG